jgi:uncharacterized membrane protein YgdD (TMEM256/DUF423 family)
MKRKHILLAGTVLAGLGVALGAVGSHAWKDVLAQHGRTDTYETAVRYQLYHALALLMVGLLADKDKPGLLSKVCVMFIFGVLLFSGSLYCMSLTNIRWVVYVTPLGGMLMIGGWVLLLIHLFKMKQ